MEPPKKILVVDDEPDTLTFLCAWLEDEGHAPHAVSDPEAVLSAALGDVPDLLLLDVHMPNQSGIQVYRSLRETPALRDLPVIFITGASDVQLFDKSCAPMPEPAGRIEKPIDLSELARAIRKALNGGGAT